jgi:hypothetical protein
MSLFGIDLNEKELDTVSNVFRSGLSAWVDLEVLDRTGALPLAQPTQQYEVSPATGAVVKKGEAASGTGNSALMLGAVALGAVVIVGALIAVAR